MTTLMAHRYCRGALSPMPPRHVVKDMQAELERKMRALGDVRPAALACGAWRITAGNANVEFAAMLSLTVERGELIGSFAAWYEWQHPRWQFINSPLPLELARTETLLG